MSHFNIYSGIELEPELGINVIKGHYPFIDGQKFSRGKMKFKVAEFVYSEGRGVLFNEKIITDVVFETLSTPSERFKIPIIQVLESIKHSRTKFSL